MTAMPTITPVLPSQQTWPLHDTAASRRIERAALDASAPHALMQRAGLAVARLASAVAPQAGTVWVAAGPGNNGGDGLVAAAWLQRWGRCVRVSLLGDLGALPADAAQALADARAAGVAIAATLPDQVEGGLCIDALLGLGATRAPAGAIAEAIARLNGQRAPVLAVDLPTGLAADTGALLGTQAVVAWHTLGLLTLKPGLFTAQGRDHAGRVWFDGLSVALAGAAPQAWLGGPPQPTPRRHAQHKGSFGDVVVVGGAPGMGGAAVLAARAALAAGAGRVFLARLDGEGLAIDPAWPELMPRRLVDLLHPALLAGATVVCGCGGGDAVKPALPALLRHAGRLVLDADALNALASEPSLMQALVARGRAKRPTVLTPHPLEAARLLGCSAAEVQADRIGQAATLARRSTATVLLKGSGSVVACPGRAPVINPTGNARLSCAGTGDVLAGWTGGHWAQQPARQAEPSDDDPGDGGGFDSACASAWLHGLAAELALPAAGAALPLRAAELVDRMREATQMQAGVNPR